MANDPFKENGGLGSASDVARELDVPETSVRAWARADGDVPRVGPSYVFRQEDVERLAQALDDEDLDDDSVEDDDFDDGYDEQAEFDDDAEEDDD